MVGPAPKTKLWTARENLHKPGGLHLLVGGQVEVSDANQAPMLSAGPSVGKVLPLDLTIITTEDPKIDTPVWKAASFHDEVSEDQFHRVQVRWDGKPIATFPVIDDREHDALTEKQTDLQNLKQGAKPTAKKAAAKAKKAVSTGAEKAKKVVKKAAKQLAKKGPKKAAKKAPKKAAKKAAKKSTLKRFVKKLVTKLAPKKGKKGKKR
jgi:hypothetical protein